jgi:hypothetical protein
MSGGRGRAALLRIVAAGAVGAIAGVATCVLAARRRRRRRQPPQRPAAFNWVVLWDFENTCVESAGVSGARVVKRIISLLRGTRPGGENDAVRIIAAGNVNKSTFRAKLQQELQSCGVAIMHVASRKPESADKLLLAEYGPALRRDGGGLAFISGDSDFSYAISAARNLGFLTAVFHPNANSTSALLANAAEVLFSWQRDVLAHCGCGATPAAVPSVRRPVRALPRQRAARPSVPPQQGQRAGGAVVRPEPVERPERKQVKKAVERPERKQVKKAAPAKTVAPLSGQTRRQQLIAPSETTSDGVLRSVRFSGFAGALVGLLLAASGSRAVVRRMVLAANPVERAQVAVVLCACVTWVLAATARQLMSLLAYVRPHASRPRSVPAPRGGESRTP